MSVLLLRLAGPLQSWGSSSRFARRATDAEPSKSGVLGLLAAAQGRRRTDSIEDLLQLRFGVRVDQPGEILPDFQTAHRPDGTSMPLTWRYYLSDAVFVAAIEDHDGQLVDGLAEAVRHPVFPLYLGRRSCPPSGQVFGGVHEGSVESVLRDLDAAPWEAADWHRRRLRSRSVRLRVVRDARPGEEGESRRDAPLSFDPTRREYGWRTVVEDEPVEVVNLFGRDDYHDPLAELGG